MVVKSIVWWNTMYMYTYLHVLTDSPSLTNGQDIDTVAAVKQVNWLYADSCVHTSESYKLQCHATPCHAHGRRVTLGAIYTATYLNVSLNSSHLTTCTSIVH